MDETKERELLLLRLMHLIAGKFRNTAVLKGGMVLRLLNSPRMTQDVDYVFTTKESRKIIWGQLKKLIEDERDLTIVDAQLNSRGIIVKVKSGNREVMLEIAVVDSLVLPPEQMTTTILSQQYQMPGQVITVMALSEAYANKIAACLERTTMRDLYDLTIYQGLTSFDKTTLCKRLNQIQIQRTKPRAVSFLEAAQMLRERNLALQKTDLEKELSGLVPSDFMVGGLNMMKNCINRICRELESL